MTINIDDADVINSNIISLGHWNTCTNVYKCVCVYVCFINFFLGQFNLKLKYLTVIIHISIRTRKVINSMTIKADELTQQSILLFRLTNWKGWKKW